MKVFLSSTYDDLVAYREHVMKVLGRREMIYQGMEITGASVEPTLESCLMQVDACGLVICLLGTRYGEKPDGSPRSYTHHEISHAMTQNKKILAYVLDEDNQPVLTKHVDHGADGLALSALKNDLKKYCRPALFTTPENLAMIISCDISNYLKNSPTEHRPGINVQERDASGYRESAYDHLAEWYDYWYDGHWNHEEPFNTVCAIARGFWESSRGNLFRLKILDCACGTGNTYVAFRKRGYKIWGTDGSREMLLRAASNCGAENVSTDNLIGGLINWTDGESYESKFGKESFDLIVNTANSFCHIPPTPEYMKRALENFYKLLKPGGVLIIDTKKYIEDGSMDGVTVYRELQFDPKEQAWSIRFNREERRNLPELGNVKFHTRLLYDVDPSFSHKVSRALIVVTIYGDNLTPRTLVVPYYPLPAKFLKVQMEGLGFETTIYQAKEHLANNWKYDVVAGKKPL